VARECDRHGYSREVAKDFFDYYEARGWKNILDWRATFRRWIRRDFDRDKKLTLEEVRDISQLRAFFSRMPKEERERLIVPLESGDYRISKRGYLVSVDSGEIHPREREYYKKRVLPDLKGFLEKCRRGDEEEV